MAKGMSRQEYPEDAYSRAKDFRLRFGPCSFSICGIYTNLVCILKLLALEYLGFSSICCDLYRSIFFIFVRINQGALDVRWFILIGYWLAMSLIPVPGYGAGAIDTAEEI